jgi:hypothetical protein
MRRILLVLTVALVVAAMMALAGAATPALADHFIASPGTGVPPNDVWVGGHRDTQGVDTSCGEVLEHEVDEQTPIGPLAGDCAVFLPDEIEDVPLTRPPGQDFHGGPPA